MCGLYTTRLIMGQRMKSSSPAPSLGRVEASIDLTTEFALGMNTMLSSSLLASSSRLATSLSSRYPTGSLMSTVLFSLFLNELLHR